MGANSALIFGIIINVAILLVFFRFLMQLAAVNFYNPVVISDRFPESENAPSLPTILNNSCLLPPLPFFAYNCFQQPPCCLSYFWMKSTVKVR
jgi:hypothetical protein